MLMKCLPWKESATFRFAVFGTVFGLLFPVLSLLIEIGLHHFTFSASIIIHIYKTVPLMYIISTAPFILGMLAYMIGKKQDKLQCFNKSLESTIEERTHNLEQKNKMLSKEINHRKKVESELLEARNTAEKASQAKSSFLSTMSHEIRTPMNAVIGMTGLLFETNLNDEQKEYAETIRYSGEALLSVINDILDYSKIESGKLELEETEFKLTDTIEDIFDLLSSKASEKGLELLYDIDSEVPDMIKCDLTRLRQIFVNLINNSLKFTEKGEILVTVKVNETFKTGHLLQMEVKDSGIGIAKDKIDLVFQSFSQADSSTTRKYGGTGLGLSISKNLVELMGGKIWIESTLGKGTSFFFTIKTGKVHSTGNILDVSPESLKGKKVLLVDDNAVNINILEKQCQGWGLQSEAFVDPLKALKSIQQENRYDIAIIDMQMPGMDGSKLTAEIRKIYNKQQLPVIMLTSLGRMENDTSMDLYSAFISKPVRHAQLHRLIIHELLKASGQKDLNEEKDPDKNQAQKISARQLIGNINILLAEDNTINQKVALRMLDKLGFSADVAANGLEVLAELNIKDYDLILMDVQMPEMDGLEASRKVHEMFQERENQRPKIIAMTANAMKEDRERCLEAGMDDYVSKPIKMETIESILIKWFANKEEKNISSRL